MGQGRMEYDEIAAAVRSAQKRATALSHQLDLIIDQLAELHNRLCNLAMMLNVIVSLGLEGGTDGHSDRTDTDCRSNDDPQ